MNSINVIRKVAIKSIVTDELKRQLDLQIKNAIKNTKNTLKVLKNEKNTFEKQFKDTKDVAQQQTMLKIQSEIAKSQQYLNELGIKEKEYKALKNGQEFVQGFIDSPVDLKLGDSFFEKLSKTEIVLHDGEIVEIRNY